MIMASPPVKSIKAKGIEVAIWAKEGEFGPLFSVSMKRRYKIKEEWKDTEYLRSGDVPAAILLLQKAFEWICFESKDVAAPKVEGSNSKDEGVPF